MSDLYKIYILNSAHRIMLSYDFVGPDDEGALQEAMKHSRKHNVEIFGAARVSSRASPVKAKRLKASSFVGRNRVATGSCSVCSTLPVAQQAQCRGEFAGAGPAIFQFESRTDFH